LDKRGRVALVTGARQGLGLAFARGLAQEGATVVAIDRDDAPELAGALRALSNAPALFLKVDVTSAEQVGAAARQILGEFGKCDIIVNNAGINQQTPFMEMELKEWRQIMTVNVESMFLICKALAGSMIEKEYGRIVNIGSDTLGHAFAGMAHYMASKGAVVGLTRGLANDLGPHGITVNCIAPGLTRTPRTEQVPPQVFDAIMKGQSIKRHAKPEDLVGAMSFLTSEAAGFMTGQTLIVDGGCLKAL
jgi:NAD(P)-dependent dehydrogenase (short-subunit alcohol dehydrogenase family)